MQIIPEELMSTPITGVNLASQTLKGEIGKEYKLLVFLRHFG